MAYSPENVNNIWLQLREPASLKQNMIFYFLCTHKNELYLKSTYSYGYESLKYLQKHKSSIRLGLQTHVGKTFGLNRLFYII